MISSPTTLLAGLVLLCAACNSGGTQATGNSTGASSSGGTATTSGTDTGGSSTTGGSSSGGGACTVTLSPSEFTPCDGGVTGCPSGMVCSTNPPFSGLGCEYSCTTTTDCPDWQTICVRGRCVSNLCGPVNGNGTFDGSCNVEGTGDGTCFPYDASGDGGNAAYGLCQQGGTIATRGATCNYVRCPASDLCAPGWGCAVENSTLPTGMCLQLCDPSASPSTCASGTACQAYRNSSDYGLCIAGN